MKLLDPETVAQQLSVSRSTVLRLIADGAIPAVCLRRGRRKNVYRIRQEVLDRWIINKERQGVKEHGGNASAIIVSEPKAASNNRVNGHALAHGSSADGDFPLSLSRVTEK